MAFNPAITTANYILGQLNAKSVGTVLSLDINDYPAKEDVEALGQARDIDGSCLTYTPELPLFHLQQS